uniref:Putative secreted protein n=1 Tax=Anopheles darlingi TaxID=43151 RepID=A0A2M4DEH9_ANODA
MASHSMHPALAPLTVPVALLVAFAIPRPDGNEQHDEAIRTPKGGARREFNRHDRLTSRRKREQGREVE